MSGRRAGENPIASGYDGRSAPLGVSAGLVAAAAFKAVEASLARRLVGSIPIHSRFLISNDETENRKPFGGQQFSLFTSRRIGKNNSRKWWVETHPLPFWNQSTPATIPSKPVVLLR